MAEKSKDANAIILAEYLAHWLPRREPGNEAKVLRSSYDIVDELNEMVTALTIQEVTDEMVLAGYQIEWRAGRPMWAMWGPPHEVEE